MAARGGYVTVYRNINVIATTGSSATTTAANLYGYYIYNNNAAVRYLKFYNKATAPASTDNALLVLTLPIPPSGGANIELNEPIPFSAGIGIRATANVADTDNTDPSANDVIVNLLIKP